MPVVHCFICSELKTIKAHNDLTIKLLFQTIGFNITQTEGDQYSCSGGHWIHLTGTGCLVSCKNWRTKPARLCKASKG